MTTRTKRKSPTTTVRTPETKPTGIVYRVKDRNVTTLCFEGKKYSVKDGILSANAVEAEPFIKAGFVVEETRRLQAKLIDEA